LIEYCLTNNNILGLACFVDKEGMLNKNHVKGIFDIWEKMDRDVTEVRKVKRKRKLMM
jgi:hypothetical protein